MGIDPSIYGQLKQIQMPDPMEAQEKAMRISGLNLQRAEAMKQAQRGDVENQRKDQEYKMAKLGGSIERLAAMNPEQRAKAWGEEVGNLTKMGVLNPGDVPDQYDDGMFNQYAYGYFNSDQYRKKKESELDMQYKRSQIRSNDAKAAHELALANGRATNPAKMIPAGEASKIGNLIGAVESAHKIEQIGDGLPTGKLQGAKDWLASKFDSQSTDRSKALADIATQRNETMSRIAGANVTADEKGRILEGIGTNFDSPEMFMGKSRSTVDTVLGKAQADIDALELAGYDTSRLKAQLELKKREINLFRREYDRKMAERKKADGAAMAADGKDQTKSQAPEQIMDLGGVKFKKVNGGWEEVE